jgi:hypothetical protein
MTYRLHGLHDAEAEYVVITPQGERLYYCGLCLQDYLVEEGLPGMEFGERMSIKKILSAPSANAV